MRNQRFHCPGPFQKWCKITSKKDSATRPAQNLKFSTSGLFLVLPASPEGTLLEAFSVHVAIQRRPEVENWGFWGGLVAEFFFEEIFHNFWRGLGQWKRSRFHRRLQVSENDNYVGPPRKTQTMVTKSAWYLRKDNTKLLSVLFCGSMALWSVRWFKWSQNHPFHGRYLSPR